MKYACPGGSITIRAHSGKTQIAFDPAMPANAGDSLPPGTVERGTLAGAKLIEDTKTGVVGKVATMGCTEWGDVERYVLVMPTGAVGARQWKERWVVVGCGSHYPVDIEFKEDGNGGAYWTIR